MGNYDHITDPELRKALEETELKHRRSREAVRFADQTIGAPRYVFSRATPEREPGAMVKVRNALDEQPRGGTILEPVGSAYRVQVDQLVLIVHDPDDTWTE